MQKQCDSVRMRIENWIMLFLLLAAVAVNIKSIFMDCDVDVEYAVAMSARMLQGDRMFLEMQEPHQTSAFLCTVLMKLFVAVTGGTTGVIVYLNCCGVLIHGAVTGITYAFLKKRVDLHVARLMSIFLLTVRPKALVFPEFSNMQLWFSILLFLSFVCYLEQQERKHLLLLSSVFLCLEIISYPSCIIVWLPIVVLLWVYSATKWKDILLFTGACFVQGCAYVGYFILRVGSIDAFWRALQHIVMGDTSHHKAARPDMGMYWGYFGDSLIWLVGSLIAALLLNWVIRRFILLYGLFLLLGLAIKIFCFEVRLIHVSLFLLMIGVAIWGCRYCTEQERKMVVVGMAVSVASFVATLLLTNMDLTTILMYLILAVMVAFIPMGKILPKKALFGKKTIKYSGLVLFCVIMLFQRMFTLKTFVGLSDPLDLGGIVRSGPAMGLVTDYMGAYVRNISETEWGQYVQPGDSVLLVEDGAVSTLGYLYGDTYVSAPSTICTPTFDEGLLEYWREYPQKYPDVVAVQCWYGELKVNENSWIMQWLDTECEVESVEEGTFWRYYRLTSPL